MQPTPPPSWAIRLLRWFCKPELADEIQGDLTEVFHHHLRTKGKGYARLLFAVNVIMFLRPFATKKAGSGVPVMTRHYLMVTVRGMKKHKLFTVINVIGLSFSMSVGLIVISLFSDIFKFDRFHVNKERIYRVISTVHDPTRRVDEKATAPLPLGEKLKELDDVEAVVRISRGIFDDIVHSDRTFGIEGYFTDPAFLQVFSFNLIRGNPHTALQQPFSLVLTRSKAVSIFGTDDILGQSVLLKALGEFTITGVLEDPPKASHLQFDVLSSFESVAPLERDAKLFPTLTYWDRNGRNYVYFLLKGGHDESSVELSLDRISKEVYKDQDQYWASFELQRLPEIVPGRDLSMQIGPKMLYLPLVIFVSLGALIVVSACFNYTNLSVARSLRRAKEVGLRKINGARRHHIVFQFLMESVIISMASLIASIWIFSIIRTHFLENSPMLGKIVDLNLSGSLLFQFFCFALVVGLIAGAMPAVIISQVRVMEALRELKNLKLVGRQGLRNSLVVVQFVISLFLLTGIGIIYRQYLFSVNHELGFDKENLLVVPLNGVSTERLGPALELLNGVKSVSYTSLLPATEGSQLELVILNDGLDSMYINTMSASANMVRDLRLRFIAGSNFPDSARGASESHVLINRRFLSLWNEIPPAEALGRVISVDGRDLVVAGVLEDFNHEDLEEPLRPFFIRNDPSLYQFAVVKLQTQDAKGAMSQIEGVWKKFSPDGFFHANFYDQEIQETYSFYLRLIRVFSYVGALALIIATLGLLGMTTYTTEARRKEVGIRKVMGASERQIITLLSRGFVVLLAIAASIALPAVYLLFDQVVLNLTAYRINISPLEMSFGVLLMLMIGGGAIVSQTLRAARSNPVETLRSE